MKRVLIVTSVASMVDQFLRPHISLLQGMGYAVDVACNFVDGSSCSQERVAQLRQDMQAQNVRCFQIDFTRNVLNMPQNLRAYRQLKKILAQNSYRLVHCHSPVGGVLGRLAARKHRKKGTSVFYTAHGFHFYRGAPKKNWLIYYPIEKFCARFTDVLITINREDYDLASRKMRAGRVCCVPGVGIDLRRFQEGTQPRSAVRSAIGVADDAFLILSVGELNENKNHQVVLRAIAALNDATINYAVAGQGEKQEQLKLLAQRLGIAGQVHLLGYRADVAALYQGADLFCFPSIREGLGLSALEAMASALPIVAAHNRGTDSFLCEGQNALLCDPLSAEDFAAAIGRLRHDEALRRRIAAAGVKTPERFSVQNVLREMRQLYELAEKE